MALHVPQHVCYIPSTPTLSSFSSDKDICSGLKPLDTIHDLHALLRCVVTVPKNQAEQPLVTINNSFAFGAYNPQ